MPSTIGMGKLFRIKHITLSEGETFLSNKHEIVFFEIKCTFFGRKENTITEDFMLPEFMWNITKFMSHVYDRETKNKIKFEFNWLTINPLLREGNYIFFFQSRNLKAKFLQWNLYGCCNPIFNNFHHSCQSEEKNFL